MINPESKTVMTVAKPLTAAQLATWPRIRDRLIKAYGSLDMSDMIYARSLVRLSGLDQTATEDLGWQVEAFLDGDWSGSLGISLREPGKAVQAFLKAGLDWNALAPAVFDECMDRLEHWTQLDCPVFSSAIFCYLQPPCLRSSDYVGLGCKLFHLHQSKLGSF